MSEPVNDGTDRRFDDGTLPLISNHIIGNYRLVRPIGSGTMGEVYLARHRQFKDRQYAIKLIRQGMISDEARTRFEREILAMGDLAHPNLVYANDAGMDGDRMYLVMEYVQGEELQCMIDQHGRFRVTFAAEIIRQICIGISHAHQRGVIHRDIKPGNVMLSDQMQVKVLDLGIASLQNDATSRMTMAHDTMGTAPFISPELWKDASNATPASDVYAIGCTAFCLLTGEPPFSGEKYNSLIAVMSAHRELVPMPLQKLRKDIPPELSRIFDRTLAKNPDERLGDAVELAKLLVPFCEPLSPDTKELFGTAVKVDLPTAQTDDIAESKSGGLPQPKLSSLAIGLLTLAIFVVAGAIAFRNSFGPAIVDSRELSRPLIADQTWMPERCQKSPNASLVTVEFGGLRERLWSEIQLVPVLPEGTFDSQSIDIDPIHFVLVPQCGTGSPMSFYLMKEKVSAKLMASFENAYPDYVDPEAKKRRQASRQSNDPSSIAFWVTGLEATQFAIQICGGHLPKPDQWDSAFGCGFSQQVFANWISADESYLRLILNQSPIETFGQDISRWGCINMGSRGLEFTRFNLETDSVSGQLGRDLRDLPERELRGQSAFSDGGVLQIDKWAESEMSGDVYFGSKPIDEPANDISFRVVLDKDNQDSG